MSDTQRYWKKRLVNENIEVEYNSERNKIDIVINHFTKNGYLLGSDYLSLHPSYIEPLYKLLKEVIVED